MAPFAQVHTAKRQKSSVRKLLSSFASFFFFPFSKGLIHVFVDLPHTTPPALAASEIAMLQALTHLDLSLNYFSGGIPSEVSYIDFKTLFFLEPDIYPSRRPSSASASASRTRPAAPTPTRPPDAS